MRGSGTTGSAGSKGGAMSIKKEKQGVLISGSVGLKNKVILLNQIKKLGLIVLNVKDVDKFIKSVEEKLQKRKERRKSMKKSKEEKVKKAEEKKKAKEKPGIEKKVLSEEEKKKEEKKEKDKLLTKKGAE